MIVPSVEIVEVERQWVIQWRTSEHVTHRRFFGNRMALCEALPQILDDVRGPAYPPVDERITLQPASETP